jgi:FkbM family methyltransferase
MNNPSAVEMCHRIKKLLAQKRNYRHEVRNLTERYPYVVFYGCGAILNSIVESWNEHVGRKIDYCCDSDSGKWGKLFCGAKCLSPNELVAIKDKCVVFVTIGDFKPVYTFLKESGFPSVNQLYKYDLVASEFLARHDQEEVLAKLCQTYELLEDEQSQKVFDAIINRVLGDGINIDIMLDVCEKKQYFPPDLIKLSEHERLVDIGAFNGDTIRDFVGRTQGKFDQIFSFEVDAINYMALQENVRKMPEENRIKIFNLGIWDSECEITYSIGESQSTVGFGEGKGHVMPLDEVLREDKVTFVKMDIEGAEPQALRGARNIIKNQKPKLAICIYHDFRHLWEIPLYIKSLAPEYKIYLRHHTNLEYETVCYAIA